MCCQINACKERVWVWRVSRDVHRMYSMCFCGAGGNGGGCGLGGIVGGGVGRGGVGGDIVLCW